MKEPMISIILPCYNHGEYIEDAIESILNQTYKNYELIIIENGSSDDSRERIRKYEDRVEKIFYYDENDCLIYTTIVDKCVGDLLAFMCSDDYWEPEKLKKQVAYITNNPSIGACFTWAMYTDKSLNQRMDESSGFEKENKENRYEWLRYFWDHCNCLSFPSAIVWKEDWMEIARDTNSLRQLWDWYAWLRILLKKDIYIIEETLVKMRRHGKNDSAINDETICRTRNEGAFIWHDLVERMSDEDFRKVFSDLLRKKDACIHEEIVCEKIFLLLSGAKGNTSLWADALSYYYKYFRDVRVSTVMKETYGKSRVDFDKYTSEMGIGRLVCEIERINNFYQALEKKYLCLLGEESTTENKLDSDFEAMAKEIVRLENKVMPYLKDGRLDRESEKSILECCINIIEISYDMWEYIEIYGFGISKSKAEQIVNGWKKELELDRCSTFREEAYQFMEKFFEFLNRVLAK